MANAAQIKALIRSHAAGDDTRFYALAMQVAAQAARSGHSRFAEELRKLVDEVREKAGVIEAQKGRILHIAQPRGELVGLLSACAPQARLADMALNEGVRHRLERVITEQRNRARLREHALSPIRKLLLVGPPGTGKTLTASALAGELGLPLFTIQLDGLITKYLGETAAKLRLLFEAIQRTRGVYLFDEFDALGSQREAKNDVGEIRRVLNSFLQFLEQDDSDSLLVAATNHPALLDGALFRRFDLLIEYALPSKAVIEQMIEARLCAFDAGQIRFAEAAEKAEGLSHADIASACEHAAKNAVLRRSEVIDHEELVHALDERRKL
jgi:SpoVK/Ycf46/Vps4 family AAA+-type ATPase